MELPDKDDLIQTIFLYAPRKKLPISFMRTTISEDVRKCEIGQWIMVGFDEPLLLHEAQLVMHLPQKPETTPSNIQWPRPHTCAGSFLSISWNGFHSPFIL